GVNAKRSDIDPSRIGNALAEQFPGYAAYAILNFLILCATFYCLLQIVQNDANDRASALHIVLASLGLLVVANDVTKAFFWSPHTQMFNVFIPVFGLYMFSRALDGALDDSRFAIATGLTTGLGLSAYLTFIVVILCTLFAGLISLFLNRRSPRR